MLENVESKAYKVDLLQIDEIKALKDRVFSDFGTVDILVNNAGLISYNTIFNESEEFIEKMARVNLIAVMLMVKTFMGAMIDLVTSSPSRLWRVFIIILMECLM